HYTKFLTVPLCKLLKQLEEYIKDDRLKEARRTLDFIDAHYDTIYCITQEVYLDLLKTYYYFKDNQTSMGIKTYEQRVLIYTQGCEMSPDLKYIYSYVSGLYYFNLKEYPLSLKYFLFARKEAKVISWVAESFLGLAIVCHKLGYKYRGIDFARKAFELFQEANSRIGTFKAILILGTLHWEIGEIKTARAQLDKALRLCNTDLCEPWKGMIYYYLGLIYFSEEDFGESLDYFYKSLKIDNRISPVIRTYYYILDIHLRQGDLRRVRQILNKVSSHIQSEEDKYILKVIKARLNFVLGNNKLYEKDMIEALNYFNKYGTWQEAESLASELAEYFAKQKRYKAACLTLSKSLESTKKMRTKEFECSELIEQYFI
ncbi:Tetratricopeptide TPR_1 repeat-containing protein, partial [Caldalkalibacillus thermarum TA2.A1]